MTASEGGWAGPVGVCTWTFGPRPLPEVLGRVARLGFGGVELFGDLARPAPEVRTMVADHGLEVLSLTPDNVDIAHPDRAVREEAVGYYLRLLDFAAELRAPLVGCHGYVPRHAPVGTWEEESDALVEAVATIGEAAAARGVTVVFEVLNRYESCHVNTAAEGLALIERAGVGSVRLLLDAYHMNIEEAAPAAALERAGPALGLYHAADSNREGIGRGHVDFGTQLDALTRAGYAGPVVLEITAPGPDPFTPVKAGDYLAVLERHLAESLAWLRRRGPRATTRPAG